MRQQHGGGPRTVGDSARTSRVGRTRLRTRLAAMVIIPLVALGFFAYSDFSTTRIENDDAAETAMRLERFEALSGLIQGLRLEQSMSEGVVALRASGTDLAAVRRSLGVDLFEMLALNRERVDLRLDAVSGRINAESGGGLARVISVRERIDARTATVDEVRETFTLATASLNALLVDDGEFLRTTLARLPQSDELNRGYNVATKLFELLSNVSDELVASGRSVIPAVRQPNDRLVIAAASQRSRSLEIELKSYLAGDDLVRFEQILSTPAALATRNAEADILRLFGLIDGTPSDDATVIATFIESQSAVADDLTAFAQDEARELAHLAREIGADTGRQLLFTGLRTSLVVAATLIMVLIVVRSIKRPLTRVEEQARLISAGSLDHPPLPSRGPVEVVVVAEAINSLTTNLQRLVAQSTAIASGQIDAAVLRQPLPGSLGASVQATMDRLTSMTTQLRQSAQHAQAIVQHVGEAIFTVTNDGVLQTVNAAGVRLLGYPAEELIGSQIRHYLRGGLRSGENSVYRSDGEDILVTLTVSQVAGTDTQTVVARDITRLKEREEQLTYQANHDALTGLTNRAAFMDALGASLNGNQAITVFFLDLDGFKGVNDTHGHPVGDELLMAFAKRFRSALRTTDVGARFGGDEFVALVHGLDDNTSSIRFGQRLIELIEQPFQLSVGTISISASVGLVRASRGLSPEEIVKRADTAAYEAKAAGKGRVRVSGNELLPGPAALLADEIRQLRG